MAALNFGRLSAQRFYITQWTATLSLPLSFSEINIKAWHTCHQSVIECGSYRILPSSAICGSSMKKKNQQNNKNDTLTRLFTLVSQVAIRVSFRPWGDFITSEASIVVLGLSISQTKDVVDGCCQKRKQMPLPRLLAQCEHLSYNPLGKMAY